MKALEILRTLSSMGISPYGNCRNVTILKEDMDNINEAIAELEALQQTKSCEWHLGDYDQNSWISKCGAEFILIEGIPSENGMKFCHKCGRKLIQIDPKEQ